jgi:hypothetical protein
MATETKQSGLMYDLASHTLLDFKGNPVNESVLIKSLQKPTLSDTRVKRLLKVAFQPY